MSNSEVSREEALKNLRSTLDWLGNDVRYLNAAVDPVLEATAINKAFDDGPAFVAENVTGTRTRALSRAFGVAVTGCTV